MASDEILAPGSVFAQRFRIVELLAETEMGAVYVVEVPPKGTRRVLKAMAAHLVRRDGLRKLFAGYAKSTSKVASTNVLQTLDAGIDRATGRPWFTTDLLRGEDLGARVARKGALPLSDVRILLAALGDALGKAHARGLVHYDLTPENIHLGIDSPLSIKLRELTISRLVSDALAAEGELIGTAVWMSPEQFDLGRRLTPAANVWSLALLAFYAATGCPYWRSASDDPSPSKDLLREILGGPIVPASDRARALGCGRLPAWFDGWFARCVIREPGKRLPNAHVARASLAESLERHGNAPADKVVDDQSTTVPLPDRLARAKGSRSLPRGIVAEAKGGTAHTGPIPPPGGIAAVDRRGAQRDGSKAWRYLMILCAAAALVVWFRVLSDRHPPVGSGATATKDETGTQLASATAAFTRSESVEAAGASAESAATAAASGSSRSDAAAPSELAERTFPVDDTRGGTADYDLAAALKALNAVYYGACAVPSAGKLGVTFAPSGRVKRVAILKGDYDEATAACISARFASARVPAFRGGEQSLTADLVATR
jgi:hypothetical protein